MKTIEQKAKAYDEVVGKLKVFMTQGVDPLITRADVQDFFPELKESERERDERIRKALLDYFGECEKLDINPVHDAQTNTILAWLEKATITQKDFAPKDKCAGCNNVKGCVTCVDGDNWAHYYYEDEQKPTDKAEPKFKVGDWITDGSITIQIEGVKNNCYLYCGDCVLYNTKTADKVYHLWTINDAKDCDVLAGKIDGDDYILIFKQIKDGWIETYGHYYNAVDRFCVPSQLFCRDYQGTLTPATKEQRDLLFQKMHEAGYTWNPDEKKLEKIEQKTWSEDDESFIKELLDYFGNLKPHKHEMDDVVDWLETLKEKYTLPNDELMETLKLLRHKWSLGDSAEEKYKVEAYDELLEMLKEE